MVSQKPKSLNSQKITKIIRPKDPRGHERLFSMRGIGKERRETKNGGTSPWQMMSGWKRREWDVMGGFDQTGAEWKETGELVRSLYDTMKPKVMKAVL